LREILEALSPEKQRLFACDCAEHLLPYFERLSPLDKRTRIAIEVARRYAVGKASPDELREACDDADDAAWEVADVAWQLGEQAGTGVNPIDDAAAPAAIVAAACSTLEVGIALESTVAMALEVVVTAAIGSDLADRIWSGNLDDVSDAIVQQYRQVETQELAWQIECARSYAASNSGSP
jgi:hypothetical protein